ncbi:ornithine carbamoyltransferase [Neisseria flavescens]|nr:ornithine carbamoyltransferase [Neisseria flavescens]
MSLKNRHFLKLLDFTPEEITTYLDLAAELKAAKKAGREVQRMKGKNIALIFEKTSTRTRCAFEVAARDQGVGVTYLEPSASQIGHKESIKDTARVLGGCLTVSNIAALGRMWWKSWPSMQACLCSMV